MKLLFVLLTISVQLLDVYSNPCRWLNDGIDCVIQCLDGTRSDTISGFVQTVYDEVRCLQAHSIVVFLA